jgi:3-oxoadipate enol-lactonase
MPTLTLSDGAAMHYAVDDYTDPWRSPAAILMLHGNAESGAAWYAWVPHLARDYRIVRPDMRGFGASTAMTREYRWSFDALLDDYERLLDALGIEHVHLIGAKLGGTIARVLAARRPRRIVTLTVAGTPPAARAGAERLPALLAEIEANGVEAWARRNMTGRLGPAFPAEGLEWWSRFMGRTALSTQLGFQRDLAYVNIEADVDRIRCPTLVITTEESGLASIEENRRWQERIPGSRLVVLPGSSYHVAASDPDRCARATLEFIRATSDIAARSGASSP